MPKVSTSARHASHQDRMKNSKYRGHQYHNAAKARKLKKTGIKRIMEEVAAFWDQGVHSTFNPSSTTSEDIDMDFSWSSATHHQNSEFWEFNTTPAFQQGIQGTFYLSPVTSEDIDMEFLDAAVMGNPVYSQSTMWISSPQLQMFYPHFGQVDHMVSIPNDLFVLKPIVIQQGFQPVYNEPINQFAQINQLLYNLPAEPLTAAYRFWVSHFDNSCT